MAHLLSKENFAKIGTFIYRNSGIHLDVYKHYDKLAKYVDKRTSKLELDDFKKYFHILRFEDNDGLEFQELINAITINDTYFFREKEQFELLVNRVLPELDESIPTLKPIRILCAPCSSGEEAYSIILHILEQKTLFLERKIEVIGIDIDSEVIKKAQTAHYSEQAVKAIPKNILNKYFVKDTLGYSLEEDIKRSVDFKVANVFNKKEMSEFGKFDVIFSRNMFIYFDESSRKEVALTFHDMLRPGSYVFLGHAEYMSRIVSVFTAKKIDNSLIYQK